MLRSFWARLRVGRLLVAAVAVASVVLIGAPTASAVTGPVGTAAGFEDDDGNLAPDPLGLNFDWNSFAPTTWTGGAPNRTSTKVFSGWTFNGLEDAQATGTDSGFAGGTKQDDECPSVITQKATNKDDLKRVYFANTTGANGHVYLMLAWVRIPQNTTSSSAHVAFEFNQGTTACGGSSDGLVHRTTANGGDMLIVYDFEGGAATPTIKLERWVASGACEVSSDSPPCWGVATTLPAGTAEAKVNTGVTVQDGIAPSPPESLGDSEFGEAGIDLTNAGVFSQNTCLAFGKGYAVSRSSGNSAQAQMKDLVGPGNLNIQNCGTVIIRKQTDPSPDPTDTTFSYTTTGGLSPSTFGLKDGQKQDYGANVFAGSYSVTESDPAPDFSLSNLDCSASSITHGTTITTNTATRTVSFNLKALDTVDCTYTNTLHTGAIKITKTSIKDNSTLAGAKFDVRKASDNSLVAQVTTGDDGTACVDNLRFGDYMVTETDAPTGYEIDDSTAHTVTVDNDATCGSGNEETISFSDTPLSRITVSFESLAPGNPTSATVQCTGDASESPLPEGTPKVLDNLAPGTYSCTVVVDP
jgi:Prealbumin-like fold domain